MKVEDYISICQKLHAESRNGMSFRAGIVHSLLLKEQELLQEELRKSSEQDEAKMICACLKAISETLDDINTPPQNNLG